MRYREIAYLARKPVEPVGLNNYGVGHLRGNAGRSPDRDLRGRGFGLTGDPVAAVLDVHLVLDVG